MAEELWRTDKEVPPFPVEMAFKENEIGKDGLVEIKNPHSGETCRLTPVAVGVYDMVKGANDIIRGVAHPMSGFNELPSAFKEQVRQKAHTNHALGIEWFMIHYPEEYYILID